MPTAEGCCSNASTATALWTPSKTTMLPCAWSVASSHACTLRQPPDGLPQLATVTAEMIDDAPAAARVLDDDDRSRLARWVDTVSAVADDTGDRLLHWDLHYGNVLAADREPWLAIDPEPLVGDPGFDLWPALDSGWSDDPTRTDAPRLVRRRFDVLTEMLDLDRRRAAAWTRARLLQNTLWDIEDGQPAISAAAKLVDDALLAAHSSDMR